MAKEKWKIKFLEKYKDYLGCAYEEIPDKNLGDEMTFDIQNLLDKQRAEIKEMIKKKGFRIQNENEIPVQDVVIVEDILKKLNK